MIEPLRLGRMPGSRCPMPGPANAIPNITPDQTSNEHIPRPARPGIFEGVRRLRHS